MGIPQAQLTAHNMMGLLIDAAGFYLNVAVFTAAFYAAVRLLEEQIDANYP